MTDVSSTGVPVNVTIKDVADAAGVSISTASYALAAAPRKAVRPETAARVRLAAEMLGYFVNPTAKALRTRRFDAVGVIGDEVDSSWAAGEIIRGAQHAARESGAVLILNTGRGDRGGHADAAAELRGRIDGVIFASSVHRRVTLAEPVDVPTVLVNAEATSGSSSCFVPDEENAGWTAADVLIRAGHRRLLFLNSMGQTSASEGRWKGFLQRTAEAGLPSEWVTETKVAAATPQAALAATYPVLGESEHPTALCCFNDVMSLGVYRAAAMLGLSVPDDLSVIAFGDTGDLPLAFLPELATIQLPDYELGFLAIEELQRLRDDPSATPRLQRVGARAILRASVAAAHPPDG